jgi:exodeoxyribonuclease V gamma subunit
MLIEKSRELLERFSEITKDWPTPLSMQAKQWSFDQQGLHAQWGNSTHNLWRVHTSSNEWLQIELRPGSVVEGKENYKQVRLETLTSLWLHHVVACASGTPTTSMQIGFNGVIQFVAISPEQAAQYLSQLVSLYALAWEQPLPVARKSACKYVSVYRSLDTDKYETQQHLTDAALSAAMQVFEGTHQRTGEYEESTSLQRVFQEFADIAGQLPQWADRIYGPIADHAQIMFADSRALQEELES